MNDHATTLAALTHSAHALRQGALNASGFSQAVANADTLIAALPPAYARAMTDLVTRLESSALFGGESCSFSHTDLYDALDVWLNKAAQRLENPG